MRLRVGMKVYAKNINKLIFLPSLTFLRSLITLEIDCEKDREV